MLKGSQNKIYTCESNELDYKAIDNVKPAKYSQETTDSLNHVIMLLNIVLDSGNPDIYQKAFKIQFNAATDRNPALLNKIIKLRHDIKFTHGLQIKPLDGSVENVSKQ